MLLGDKLLLPLNTSLLSGFKSWALTYNLEIMCLILGHLHFCRA